MKHSFILMILSALCLVKQIKPVIISSQVDDATEDVNNPFALKLENISSEYQSCEYYAGENIASCVYKPNKKASPKKTWIKHSVIVTPDKTSKQSIIGTYKQKQSPLAPQVQETTLYVIKG